MNGQEVVMTATHTIVSIPVADGESVSAVLLPPEQRGKNGGPCVVIAHGAGNDRENPLLVAFAQGLTAHGCMTLRFNFPYKEKGGKSPDPPDKLALTWQRVIEFLRAEAPIRPGAIIAAGKSMGGRVASRMAAEGLLDAERLIFLGYPLHPPGRKDHLRDAHLYDITMPMLFFAGTRDPLCDLGLLQGVMARIQAPHRLHVMEGGDHSLNLSKSAESSQSVLYNDLVSKAWEWIQDG
jgi:uncharacterized protein